MKPSMKIDEIRKVGLDALRKSLGPDGMIRFLQQFESGSGDYSKNRHEWLDEYDVERVYSEMKKR